ncbi:MAG: response regulator [Spirochaetes bacterium]|nr:response regulator [Spirochaetota bacterium]
MKEKIKVLIVEDETIISIFLENLLIELGYEVCGSFIKGKQCLNQYQQLNPHIILMDIALRGKINGIETAKIIYEQSALPVIFLTAYSDMNLIQKAKQVYPFGYIIKPFEKETIHTAIEIAMNTYYYEQKIKQNEHKLLSIITHMNKGIIITNHKGQITEWNLMCEEITGLTKDYVLGKYLWDVDYQLLPAEKKMDTMYQLMSTSILNMLEENSQLNKNSPKQDYTIDIQGSKKTIRSSIFVIPSDEGKNLISILDDITEDKKNEDALRNLTNQLQQVQEEERKFITEEIQNNLRVELDIIKDDFDQLVRDCPKILPACKNKIDHIHLQIKKMVQDLQYITTEIRPQLIDHENLNQLISWEVEQFRKKKPINCQLHFSQNPIHISKELTITLYRIIQEGLKNIDLHSQATDVIINIERSKKTIEMQIIDNGIGISQEKIESVHSVGLLQIKERVHKLNGNLIIKGEKDKGTIIKIILPLD